MQFRHLPGLTANYAGFPAPKLALGSSIAPMMLWRPRGSLPVAKEPWPGAIR
jgi:branched-chain amino acid transport system permease protein